MHSSVWWFKQKYIYLGSWILQKVAIKEKKVSFAEKINEFKKFKTLLYI